MPWRQEALRGEGEDHRRHEPLRERGDRLARAGLEGAAAGPDERAARALEQLERALELLPVGRPVAASGLTYGRFLQSASAWSRSVGIST